MSDNKNSYFMFELRANGDTFNEYTVKEAIEKVENAVEPVLSKIGATEDTYAITSKQDISSVVFLVRTSQRRRLSLLRNTINKNIQSFDIEEFRSLPNEKQRTQYSYDKIHIPKVVSVLSMTKKSFNAQLDAYKSNKNFAVKSEASIDNNYKGKDVQLFGKMSNWHPWQKKLYKLIYGKDNNLRTSDDRSIILVVDEAGKNGKSKFAKFLYLKNREEIMVIAEGSASQLRSAIVGGGTNKKLYIVDLPRTVTKESTDALLNVLESLKNGLLLSHMYGRSDNNIIINPPTIVVFSNKYLSANLSVDRWDSYALLKNHDWKDITKDVQKKAAKTISINRKIENKETELLEYKYAKIQQKVTALKKSQEASYG